MQHGRTPRDGLSVITKLPGADKLFVALSTPPAHVSTEPVRGLAQGGTAFQTHITPLFALLASFCVNFRRGQYCRMDCASGFDLLRGLSAADASGRPRRRLLLANTRP